MTAWLHSPAAEALGWTLLHAMWQLALIALFAAAALAALRRRAPNLRYLVACAALLLMAAAPAITFAQLRSRAQGPRTPTPGVATASDIPFTITAAVTPATTLDPSRAYALPLKLSPAQQIATLLQPCLPPAVALYICGTTLLALRLSLGLVRLRQLQRTAQVAPALLQNALAQLRHRLAISRPVRLRQSPHVEVPTVIGLFRPIILLPLTALTGLSPDQLSALIAHELAHIRRHDCAVNLLQTTLETLLFYHPALWWLSARIRQERELCCDDIAVALTGNRLQYARTLAAMESLRPAPAHIPAAFAMGARNGALLPRIRRLLGIAPATAPASIASTAALFLMLLSAVIYIGCNRNAAAPSTSNTAASPSSMLTTAGTARASVNPDPNAPIDRILIAWEARMLVVPNDFLDDFRIGWNLSLPADRVSSNLSLPTGDSKEPAGASIIDNWTLNQLLTAIQADKRSITITSPRITAFNNQLAEIKVTQLTTYIAGYAPSDPANPAALWINQPRTLETGIFLRVTSDVSADRRYVVATPQVSVTTLQRMDHAPASGAPADKNLQVQVPVLSKFFIIPTAPIPGNIEVAPAVSIPDGGTLLIDGGPYKSPDAVGHLLILMRPQIIIHRDAETRPDVPSSAADLIGAEGLTLPDITYRPIENAADRELQFRLEAPVKEIAAEAQGLEKLVNYLRDTTNTNIFVNWKALDAAGVTRETPVTVALKEVSFKEALTTILRKASRSAEKPADTLSFLIDQGIITISTRADLNSSRYLGPPVVYDVRDLIAANIDAPAPLRSPTSAATIPSKPQGIFGAEHADPAVNLIQSIKTLIDPDSWTIENGGRSIRYINGQLIVSQSNENQKLIHSLLTELRERQRPQILLKSVLALIPDSAIPKELTPAKRNEPRIIDLNTDPKQNELPFLNLQVPPAEILSRPMLLLNDNQPAVITVGQSIPFIAGYARATGSVQTAADAQWIPAIEHFDSGIKLHVTARLQPAAQPGAAPLTAILDVDLHLAQLLRIDHEPAPHIPADAPRHLLIDKPVINDQALTTRLSAALDHTIVLIGPLYTGTDVTSTSPASAPANKPPRRLVLFLTPRAATKPGADLPDNPQPRDTPAPPTR